MNDQPQPASTVVVCNVSTNWPTQVLLIKRSMKAAFLPGAHVFPGGRIENADEKFGEFLLRDHTNMARIKQFFADDLTTVSRYLAAAIRETLEETAISTLKLSRHGTTHFCNVDELQQIIHHPERCQEQPLLDNYWPISWWITPHGETRRFNTWFFLAFAAGSDARVDLHEADDLRWLSPENALLAYEKKDIFLAPPTRSVLERMKVTKSLEDFLSFVDRPLIAIKPYFVDGPAGEKILVLPGDPLHHEVEQPRLLLRTRYNFY